MTPGSIRANLPLFIGIAIPIVFIGVVAAVAFVPSWFVHPQYDFLYTNQGYDYQRYYLNTYVVSGGHVTRSASPEEIGNSRTGQIAVDAPKLYRYSVKDGTSHQIEFKDAEAFSVDPGPASPDGYTVEYRSGYYGGSLFFGGGGSDAGLFVTKGSAAKRLRGVSAQPYSYQNGFQLVGWVTR